MEEHPTTGALTASRAALLALAGLIATPLWSYSTCAHWGDPGVWVLTLVTAMSAGAAIYVASPSWTAVLRIAVAVGVAAIVLVAVRTIGVLAALAACGN